MPPIFQLDGASTWRGGEGIEYDDGHVFFVTKRDNRVWDLDVSAQKIRVVYDRASDPLKQLSGVDNLTVTRGGDLLVAEDGAVALELLRTYADSFSLVGEAAKTAAT